MDASDRSKFCHAVILLICVFLSQIQAEYVDLEALYETAKTNGLVDIHPLSNAKNSPIKIPERSQNGIKRSLQIFCNTNTLHKDLKNIWTTTTLKLIIPTEDFQLYQAENESAVYNEHHQTSQSWLNLMPWKTESVSLPPFNKTCIGVASRSEYSVRLVIKIVDPWLVGYLLTGFFLYLSAHRLSKNILFFYGSGLCLGVFASLLIVVFVLSRFIPKKSGMVLVVTGWSFTLYLIQYLWKNIQGILENYYQFVIGYFLVAAVISVIVCYVKGPVTNPKVLDVIKWTIQIIGLTLAFNGTQVPEVSVTLIALVVIHNNFPPFISRGLKSFWRRRFPPKVRLLTNDEYDKQGAEETRKALEDLREYCRSPNCDAWKTISRLNSPQRFAGWVEGSSHLSDDELYAFEDEPITATPVFMTDDEDEVDFILNSP